MSIEQAIALNRFGFGTRPDDKQPADPKQWLRGQIDGYDPRPALVAAQPDTIAIATRLADLRRTNDDDAFRKAEGALRRETYRNAVTARLSYAVVTDLPFAERLVHFWANHFAVSAEKGVVMPFVGSFEAEAIRPHVMGRFEDMLLAVEQHPAMLIYLDQAQSIGPDSPAGQRIAMRGGKQRGLNENLAREIMELHTLGRSEEHTSELQSH